MQKKPFKYTTFLKWPQNTLYMHTCTLCSLRYRGCGLAINPLGVKTGSHYNYCTKQFIGESNIRWIYLWEAIGRFYIGNSSYFIFLLKFLRLELWLYGHVHIVINIDNFNIGKFSEKSPITNINSSPINRLVQYHYNHRQYPPTILISVHNKASRWKEDNHEFHRVTIFLRF